MTEKQKRFADEYGKVYLITNLINGKQYVGITTRTIKERFDEHCKANSAIGKAIRKYGSDNFDVCELDIAKDKDELLYLEVQYIAEYDSFKKGYNQTIGGDGVKLIPPLEIKLNQDQKSFLEKLKVDSAKEINVRDNRQMTGMLLKTLTAEYLISTQARKKIAYAKLICRLKDIYKIALIKSGLIDYSEVIHYAQQKLSSFEVFCDG